jgi:hypothetical protein
VIVRNLDVECVAILPFEANAPCFWRCWGMTSHTLRAVLAAANTLLLAEDDDNRTVKTAALILRSSVRMSEMVSEVNATTSASERSPPASMPADPILNHQLVARGKRASDFIITGQKRYSLDVSSSVRYRT